MGSVLGRPKAKTEPAYKVRQQVLAIDTLLDVFSYVDRRTLDGANVVSYAYNAAAQHPSPLRRVRNARLYRSRWSETFHVVVCYKRAYVDTTKGGMKNKLKVMRMVADDMDEAIVILCRCLCFCNVSSGVRLLRVQIPPQFIDQLKGVAKHFLCEDNKLGFTDVTLADGVHALGLLLAFPSFRKLNDSTFDLFKESVGSVDDRLKAVASRGAFYLFADWP
ncbi:hypothetical protein AAVH_42348, partial [Aphelenchoides avenae]